MWIEIFAFLYAQFEDHPDAAFVGFFLGYDFTQWLRALPEHKAWLLLADKGKRRRTLTRGGRKYVSPVRLNEDRITDNEAWEVEWLANRRLSIRPMRCDCALRPGVKCPHRRLPYMHICDAGPFFQTSFLKVIDTEQWPDDPVCTAEEYWAIERGKQDRPDARLDDAMRTYNRLENEVLARVMVRLDQGFRSLGIRLAKGQWYGPGAPAAEWLEGQHAPRREVIEARMPMKPSSVLRAAEGAYLGGWFEVIQHGPIPGTTYEYDIRSAYPAAIAELPCLLHGEWRHHVGSLPPPLSAGQIRLIRTPPGGVQGSHPCLGAMLHRRRDGSIVRPNHTGGWYWANELEAAQRAGLVDFVEVHETWTYCPCPCLPPLAGVRDLYAHRQSVGSTSPSGKAAKLVANALYGKMVQAVGSRPFANMIYGGLITASCRTHLLDAIATHPLGAAGVVMVATDALFFSRPHPGLQRSSDLGAWELKKHRNLTILKPGVYWDDEAREAYTRRDTPLFKARGINARAFAHHLVQLDAEFVEVRNAIRDSKPWSWPAVTYWVDFAMVSGKTALQRHRWDNAGRVSTAEVRQSADPRGKRTNPYFDSHRRVIRTCPYSEVEELASYPYVRMEQRQLFADLMDGEELRTEADDFHTPDGPAGALFYGQLGTGQWA